MNVFAVWMVLGLIGSLLAVCLFRRNAETVPVKELYMAILGPFFGPIIIVLVIIDLLKKRKKDSLFQKEPIYNTDPRHTCKVESNMDKIRRAQGFDHFMREEHDC